MQLSIAAVDVKREETESGDKGPIVYTTQHDPAIRVSIDRAYFGRRRRPPEMLTVDIHTL